MIQPLQCSAATFAVNFLKIITLSALIFLPLSNPKAKEKTPNHLAIERLKTEILEDSAFLSKLSEKLTPHISDNYIQQLVKNYLLDNPEIILEMQLALQENLEKEIQKQALVIKSLEEEIFKSSNDAIFGNPDGEIELVEFFDYNCRHCKRFYLHMEALIKEYSNLRVIIKDFPILGADSTAAHTVSYVFRKQFPQKYPQFYKELLTSKSRATEANAIKIAVALGANETELRNAISDPEVLESFRKNIRIASALNITGAPSYIIGDRVFIGAASKDILKTAIENLQ
ncbi:outer membrane protein [Bartonella australis AUST/NH1]|uniref:Outer membrane protein n=1 Tax=Bartonella australis (strain Aust/NH1) TaxID=1094489 RepID=M1NYG9_BARAA|nr:DsbA family protein [Bartonella australis]AGF74487.1 outer membrane protein [Bartonella australis AUST/NH1]